MTYSISYSAFLYNQNFRLSHLLCLLISAEHRQAMCPPLSSLCPTLHSHITFLPSLTLSNRIVSVQMHNMLTSFSCQTHNPPFPAAHSRFHSPPPPTHTTGCGHLDIFYHSLQPSVYVNNVQINVLINSFSIYKA